jgi:hypothetical protein
VTDAIRAIMAEMRAGAELTAPESWATLAETLNDLGLDREAKIARTQAAVLTAECGRADLLARCGCEQALDRIESELAARRTGFSSPRLPPPPDSQ